ncbi:hypothetical protein AAA799D07_00325 [Marine Group I thaumarchaeote SCGC AAA799-D07]|nr:hypothetical protein AAA799D07_00325 [Marine Group I thaumarchaeote SCGC AAA799-D07]
MEERNFKFMRGFFHRQFTITIILFFLIGLIIPSNAILNSWAIHESESLSTETPPIPDWIKNTAGWWADGKISEDEFLQAIGYLIDNKIILITNIQPRSESIDGVITPLQYKVPAWIKNNASWWASDQIPDSAFVSGLKWLIENKIMYISDKTYLSGLSIEDIKFSNIVTTDKHEFVYLYSSLFEWYVHPESYIMEDGLKKWVSPVLGLNPYKMDQYNEVALWHDDSQRAVVVFPTFTNTAYEPGGFYDYYRGECDDCTTTTIKPPSLKYTSSGNAIQAFTLLGYDIINDIDVDKNPAILKKYDKVIILHNEYVTQTIFDAVTSHPKIIYLYPNALYALIDVDYEDNTITLIRGHDYPPEDPVSNGFDWEFDNTHPYEYDSECLNMELYTIHDPRSNYSEHWMTNCYPDQVFYQNEQTALSLLKAIKDL